MNKNIKKVFIYFTCTFMFTSAIMSVNTKKVSAASVANIRYITTSVGENETSMGINYQADVEESYVTYSTNKNFTTATTVAATASIFSADQVNNDANTGWNSRYVCTVNLTNLAESTTYYYKVTASGEESSVHSFTTGSASSTTASFLFASDIHASAGYNTTATTNNNLINILKKNKKINVAILTGDQVDRGGYESEWNAYYNGMTVFDNYAVAAIPGNHEYYHSSDASYVSPLYFNQFFNNPKNGPTDRLNSSYYFTYGNVLIIMIDTINREYLEEQKAWFKQVVAENARQWIIVGTHAGAITAGSYADDARWIQNNWVSTFEECQVDLCISGHEHVYIRKDLSYKNTTDENLGVTYLVGCAAGHKQYSGYQTDGLTVRNLNNAANVINVTANKMTVTLYDGNGDEVGESFTLSPKRLSEVTSLSDDEILDALDFEYDKDEETATLNWIADYYGNVQKINISRDQEGSIKEYEILTTTSNITSYTMLPIYDSYNYEFNVTITKTNGEVLTKTFTITNRKQYLLTLKLNGGKIENENNYLKYSAGATNILPIPTKENAIFAGWYDNKSFNGDAYTQIPTTATGEQTFYAKWYYVRNITYNTNGGTFDTTTNTYTEGSVTYLDAPTKKGYIFVGWYLDAKLKGEPITAIDESQLGDITLYAKWQKESTCSSKTISLIISTLSTVSLCYFILKKKL